MKKKPDSKKLRLTLLLINTHNTCSNHYYRILHFHQKKPRFENVEMASAVQAQKLAQAKADAYKEAVWLFEDDEKGWMPVFQKMQKQLESAPLVGTVQVDVDSCTFSVDLRNPSAGYTLVRSSLLLCVCGGYPVLSDTSACVTGEREVRKKVEVAAGFL